MCDFIPVHTEVDSLAVMPRDSRIRPAGPARRKKMKALSQAMHLRRRMAGSLSHESAVKLVAESTLRAREHAALFANLARLDHYRWQRDMRTRIALKQMSMLARKVELQSERAQADSTLLYNQLCARNKTAVANSIRLQMACALVYFVLLVHWRLPHVTCAPPQEFTVLTSLSYVRGALCRSVLGAQDAIYSMMPTAIGLLFVVSPLRGAALAFAVASLVLPAAIQSAGLRLFWAFVPSVACVAFLSLANGWTLRRYLEIRAKAHIGHEELVDALDPPVGCIPRSLLLVYGMPVLSMLLVAMALWVSTPDHD